MKNKIKIFLLLLLAVPTLFVACSNDDEDPFVEGNTTTLQQKIAIGYDSLSVAKPENFEQSSIDAFKSKLDLMSSLIESGNLSEQEVINMGVHFDASFTTYLNSRMFGIPAEYLVGGWGFEEEGEVLIGEGDSKLVANLRAGASEIFGANAGYPTFINEGVNGKAIHLSNGAHLAIDQYSANALLGQQLTITVWVKPDVIKGGNYIASLNDWNNWKFQLQDQAKSFFTLATSAGITDADNERDMTAPTNVWTHLAIVIDLDSETPLSFYTNGRLVKAWTKAQRPSISGTQRSLPANIPLLIGAAVQYDPEWGEISPQSWNYFEGAIDEIKFYNTAPVEGQIRWLYNQEVANLE